MVNEHHLVSQYMAILGPGCLRKHAASFDTAQSDLPQGSQSNLRKEGHPAGVLASYQGIPGP